MHAMHLLACRVVEVFVYFTSGCGFALEVRNVSIMSLRSTSPEKENGFTVELKIHTSKYCTALN